jgi:hypothetical protein
VCVQELSQLKERMKKSKDANENARLSKVAQRLEQQLSGSIAKEKRRQMLSLRRKVTGFTLTIQNLCPLRPRTHRTLLSPHSPRSPLGTMCMWHHVYHLNTW